VRPFRECYRGESPLCIPSDLLNGEIRIREKRDAERHDPIGVGEIPGLEEPVVPRPDAGKPELAILGHEKDPPAKAGYLGREIHRCPDAVYVHVTHPRLDVVAAGTHLVEAKWLEAERIGPTSGDRIHPDLCVVTSLELPYLVTLGSLDDPGSALRHTCRHPADKRVDRLDHVIIHRDHSSQNLARLWFRQEQV
jgi:hypothetical protein